MEKNGEIGPKQTAQLKELVKDPAINDQGLLTIFEKSYQKINSIYRIIELEMQKQENIIKIIYFFDNILYF